MKRFMLLHFGFEKPTPEIMAAWNDWFAAIADRNVEQGGFIRGREISKGGALDLPMDAGAITGFNIIEAEDLEAAERIAASNPYITGIRVYEIRSMG